MAPSKEFGRSSSSIDLNDDSTRDHLLEGQEFQHKHRSKRRSCPSWVLPVVGHFTLVLIYTIIFLNAWRIQILSSHASHSHQDIIPYSQLANAGLQNEMD